MVRNLIWLLSALAAAALVLFVLLPVIGIVLVILAGFVLLALAAPFLARLPFFRRWIKVERYGNMRTVRFGQGTTFGSYAGGSRGAERPPQDPDAIDVEGREIPDEEEELPPRLSGPTE